jgi:hypothetical protein
MADLHSFASNSSEISRSNSLAVHLVLLDVETLPSLLIITRLIITWGGGWGCDLSNFYVYDFALISSCESEPI